MNLIDGVSPYSIIGTGDAAQLNEPTEREEFLELLVAQMKYQDPLNPLDGTDFTAQMAQFSSLEQLQNINSKLDSGVEADMLLARSINNTLATTLVGKEIRAVDDAVTYDGSSDVTLNFSLAGNTSSVEIEVMNADGELLRTITASGLKQGDRSVVWNGNDSKGNNVPAGEYYFSVSASTATGATVEANPLALGRVDAVRFIDGNPVLVVGGREISFGSVLEILDGDSDSESSPELQLLSNLWGK